MAEALIGLLERRRGQDGAYIGCMKSGDVISEEYILYYIFFYIKCDCFHPWQILLYACIILTIWRDRNGQTFEGHELSVERSLVLFDLYFSWISSGGNSPSVILPFQIYFG